MLSKFSRVIILNLLAACQANAKTKKLRDDMFAISLVVAIEKVDSYLLNR